LAVGENLRIEQEITEKNRDEGEPHSTKLTVPDEFTVGPFDLELRDAESLASPAN